MGPVPTSMTGGGDHVSQLREMPFHVPGEASRSGRARTAFLPPDKCPQRARCVPGTDLGLERGRTLRPPTAHARSPARSIKSLRNAQQTPAEPGGGVRWGRRGETLFSPSFAVIYGHVGRPSLSRERYCGPLSIQEAPGHPG